MRDNPAANQCSEKLENIWPPPPCQAEFQSDEINLAYVLAEGLKVIYRQDDQTWHRLEDEEWIEITKPELMHALADALSRMPKGKDAEKVRLGQKRNNIYRYMKDIPFGLGRVAENPYLLWVRTNLVAFDGLRKGACSDPFCNTLSADIIDAYLNKNPDCWVQRKNIELSIAAAIRTCFKKQISNSHLHYSKNLGPNSTKRGWIGLKLLTE